MEPECLDDQQVVAGVSQREELVERMNPIATTCIPRAAKNPALEEQHLTVVLQTTFLVQVICPKPCTKALTTKLKPVRSPLPGRVVSVYWAVKVPPVR